MIFVLFGPSGSGKSTIEKLVKEIFQTEKLISDTTRMMREGEINGVDYYFKTEQTFLESLQQGEYLEYTIYANHYYGSRKDSYKELLDAGKNLVMVMNLKGVLALKKAFPNQVIALFVSVSPVELKLRMLKRGDSMDKIEERLENIQKEDEYGNQKYADYIIDNNSDDLSHVRNQLESIKKDLG